MAIDVAVEEVASNLEEIAEATRRVNTTSVGWFMGGVAVGAVIGFYFGHKYNKEKIKAEAFKQSQEEVERIRETYMQKTVAATPKPSVEVIVEERGYDRPLKPPVPGLVDPTPVSAPPVVIYDGGKSKDSNWDYEKEIAGRLEGQPYVIHQDEFSEGVDGYNKVAYTYYAGDDVLVDEENGHPLPHGDIVVGLNNLQFGHGTDDIDVVFVRNDELQLEMEICRTPDSYEEKVLGVENSDEHDPDDD